MHTLLTPHSHPIHTLPTPPSQLRAFIAALAFLPDEGLAALPARSVSFLLHSSDLHRELSDALQSEVSGMPLEVRGACGCGCVCVCLFVCT